MRKNVFYSVIVILATIMVVPGVFAEGKVVVYSTNQQAQNDMMAADRNGRLRLRRRIADPLDVGNGCVRSAPARLHPRRAAMKWT